MPVTKSRKPFYDTSDTFDQANTTGFLGLDGEDDNATGDKLYVEATSNGNFPTLVRRQEYPNMVSS